MSTITLDSVTKEYGSLRAVDDVSVEIPDGSYTMILGPSGCGKSTTLRMIAGLESPTSGSIRFDGEDLTGKPPRDRGLSMVFQNLALWDHKTVRENMAFGLKMAGVPSAERTRRVEEIAEVLRISDKLDDSPASLSGGQQQRVALGRSLVREPEVVLLDEPLSSLDAKLRIEMRTELLRIQRRTGISFVHVTHNQEDAMSIADEILLFDDGKLQQFGAPMELFGSPTNRFVANFIGTPGMNLFDATVVDNGDGVRIDAGEFHLDVDGALGERVTSGAVEAGVRPTSLTPVRSGEELSPSFDAEVTVVETYGDNNWYYLDAGTDEELVMKSADEAVIDSLQAGDEVRVGVSPDELHLFDPTTGEAQL